MKGIIQQIAGVIMCLVSLIVIKLLGLPTLITVLLVAVTFGALIYVLAGGNSEGEATEHLTTSSLS